MKKIQQLFHLIFGHPKELCRWDEEKITCVCGAIMTHSDFIL